MVTDSREAVAGSLYVAKPGENADGHSFVGAAFDRGAVLALTEREIKDDAGRNYPSVVVEDAVLAMGALAAEAVRRIRRHRESAGEQLTVIGITGSAGKTTTKDLLAGILSAEAPTVAPQGSYNGEVGVPLTVFQAGFDTRFLVIEMGATGIGHIRYLADMVRPEIGVVLGVGTAHAGEFGGVENIAAAKGELVEAVPAAGTAVLNLDDPRVAAMAARTRGHGSGLLLPGCRSGRSAVRAANLDTNAAGNPEFDLVLPGGSPRSGSRSKLIGEHHVANLLAAAAAAHAAGIPAHRISASLSAQSAASRWRMERTERPDGVTVINDAYNANPESMRAALRTLADLGRGRRTWAVLGAMLELGDDSIREHTAVGTQVVRLNISRLLVVGREARHCMFPPCRKGPGAMNASSPRRLMRPTNCSRTQLEPGDLVLFKSSNSVGLRHLGDRIALPPHATRTTANEGSELL